MCVTKSGFPLGWMMVMLDLCWPAARGFGWLSRVAMVAPSAEG
ncbi:hypothetical protein Pd630_LPD13059 (plasmid) [Rhodococcus opacus PD630]|nr:hypothetical protein Pd630_LPD13059 [Rhodococcus opacus PD630]